jgi:large subunit ribosomal protein L25
MTAKKVRVDLPVRTKGAAKGVLNGGKLNMAFRTLSCFGLPGDLPDAITVDITPIRIGQSIRVSEVKIPGVTIMDPANAVVLGVKISRGAVDEEEEEETAEGAEGTEGEGAEGEAENKEKAEK